MQRVPQVVVGLLLSCCSAVTFADDSNGMNGVIPIYNCKTISQPGSYQVVANLTLTAANMQTDLAGLPACIVIAASNVTLDLGGHTVFGPSGGLMNTFAIGIDGGAFGGGFQGIIVRNGVVTGFYDGVSLYGSGHSVQNVQALKNANVGIAVISGDGYRVVGNSAVGNYLGIVVQCPALVLQNVSSQNAFNQPSFFGGNVGCTFAENVPAP